MRVSQLDIHWSTCSVEQISAYCDRLYGRRLGIVVVVLGVNGRYSVDEAYLLKLLPRLPPGDSGLYSHPSLDKFRHEFDALVSPRVREQVEKLGIGLIRYQDL